MVFVIQHTQSRQQVATQLKLDELIRATREAGLGDRYLDAKAIAEFLGYSYPYVRDQVVHRPDFPKPLRLGHARWLKSEVARWARTQT